MVIKNKNIDVMADARKDPRFSGYAKKIHKLIESKLKDDKGWIAYYLPYCHTEQSRYFRTKKLAEKYIASKACVVCKKKKDILFTACGSEWLLMPYKKYIKAKNNEDLMKAGGWKLIKKNNYGIKTIPKRSGSKRSGTFKK